MYSPRPAATPSAPLNDEERGAERDQRLSPEVGGLVRELSLESESDPNRQRKPERSKHVGEW